MLLQGTKIKGNKAKENKLWPTYDYDALVIAFDTRMQVCELNKANVDIHDKDITANPEPRMWPREEMDQFMFPIYHVLVVHRDLKISDRIVGEIYDISAMFNIRR